MTSLNSLTHCDVTPSLSMYYYITILLLLLYLYLYSAVCRASEAPDDRRYLPHIDATQNTTQIH